MSNSKNFHVEGMSFGSLTKAGPGGEGAAPYFCIPAYQRQYTWKKPQVLQLLGDVYDYFLEACSGPKESAFSEKFIGAFILVEKDFQKKQPKLVYDVIDGQQRLTTLSLTFAAGVKVLLEITNELIKLREISHLEAEGSLLDKNVTKAIRKIGPFIRNIIAMLCGSPSEYKYAPSLYREKVDAAPKTGMYGNIPKACEIMEMSDEEIEASYKSVPARFFFYLAKIRLILSVMDIPTEEFNKALACLETGEGYLLSSDGQESYKENYNLAYDFLSQLQGRMVYEGEVEDLPFNGGLGDEHQFDPRPMPKSVHEIIKSDSDLMESLCDLEDIFDLSDSDERYVELKRITNSAFYVLSYLEFLASRVSIAVISGNRETALDIFETMNTAGQPLGCIETFVPEIYQTIADLEKDNSESKNSSYLERKCSFGIHENLSIEEILSEIQKVFGIDKNRAGVPQVIIWFALICFGCKVGKNFQIQRSELTKHFKEFIGLDRSTFQFDSETTWKKIHEFVSMLSFVGKWWVLCYGESRNKENKDVPIRERLEEDWVFENGYMPTSAKDGINPSELEIFNFCISFLISAKQTLSVAIVGRYYLQLLKCPTSANLRELIKAAKAVAAFTALWLSGEKGSTQYAETQRRTMVHDIDSNKIKQIPGKLSYFWRSTDTSGIPVSVQQLQKSFISGYEVKKKNEFSLKTWMDSLPNSEMASLRKEVNRFLLMLNWQSSNSNKSYADFGIRQYAEKSSQNFLSGKYWWELSKLEIEHIVPQEPQETKTELGFDPKSSDGIRFLNELGNTTLLPKKLNIYASNNKWDYKQRLYDIVCASDSNERNDILKNLDGIQENDKKTIEKQIKNLYNEIENVDTFLVNSIRHIKEWNKVLIQTRTTAIAMIVWPLLSDWLGDRQEFNKSDLETILEEAKARLAEKESSGKQNSPNIDSRLMPFFKMFAPDLWRKISTDSLIIDNDVCYLDIQLSGNSVVLLMGKRRGPSIRMMKNKTRSSLECSVKSGEEKNCKGSLFIYKSKGDEGDAELRRILKCRIRNLMADVK